MADNGNSCLDSVIERAFPFMDRAMQGDNKLLIHCNNGQNRSPTIVMAWLVLKTNRTLFDSYRLVKTRREMVQPHKSYIGQLRELDLKVNKIYSIPPEFLTMSYNEGTLNLAHESMTANQSSNYMKSQLDVMNTEQ